MKQAETMMLHLCDVVVPEHQNSRQVFNQSELIELQESILNNTQLHPVMVNQVGTDFYLIAGERRYRAIEAAEDSMIEAKVFSNLTPREVMQIRRAENRDRVGLNHIETALDYNKMLDAGMTVDEIASDEHVSPDTVRNKLNLLKLNDEVQRMVVREINPLPVHQANLIGRLSESKQIEIARQAAPMTGPVASEQQVREWVDTEIKGRPLGFEDDGDGDEHDDNHRADTGTPRDSTPPRSMRDKHKTTGQMTTDGLKLASGMIVITGPMVLQGKMLRIKGMMSVKDNQGGQKTDFKCLHEFLLEPNMVTLVKAVMEKKAGSKAVEPVTPMDARIGIAGKVTPMGGSMMVKKATLSLKVGDTVKTANIKEMTLDMEDDAMKDLAAAFKKEAKKETDAADKKDKKAVTKKGGKGNKAAAKGGCATENQDEAEE